MFKEYKKGDILTLGGYKYTVCSDAKSKFYLSEDGYHNDLIFTYLDVNKFDYVTGVLGYCNAGEFPECNNIEDLNKLICKLQEDCLIKEAKERYPKGTKFTPAHTPNLKNEYCISHGEFWINEIGTVLATLKDGSKTGYADVLIESPSENGNTVVNRNVFYQGRWAEVYNNDEHIPNYIKITNNSNAYIRHPSATKYGCSNYDYNVTPENGWVCKVLNEVLVNDVEKCYILEHNGKHYIVGKAGCVPCDGKLDKPKFEVGKYYSFNWIYSNDGGNRTVIAKIKTINTITIDVSWRNYLWYNDSFPKYSNDDTYKLDEIADIKELSIEEVQQYLPDDHPDKIIQNNLIPGKWYKVKGLHEYIAKFIGIKDGYFITPGYYIQNGEYALICVEHNKLIDIANRVFTEVPIEEVQQYLPDGHPDKIIKKKYTLKDLIDDEIIVYIDSQEEFDKISKAGKKIKGFNHTTKYWGKYCYSFKYGSYSSNSSKTNTGGYDTDCIIITIDDIIFPEEPINYVGRYIKFLVANTQNSGVRAGDIYKVIDIDGVDTIIFKRYDGVTMRVNYRYLGKNFILMPKDYTPEPINPCTDYIIGKWYKLGEWIAKFSKLEKDQFWFSLAGTPHDNYKSFEPGFLSIKIHGTPKLITDMTEVYKLFTEEKSYTSDLQLGRWYEEGDFIVYLHARNSVYGFHRDYWFKSNGFSEKGLKLCHPKKLEDKFNKYIRSQYQTEDIVSCAYDRQVFKIQELNLGIHRDRVTISASGVKKRYGYLFYQGEWAEKVSSIKELNLTTQNNNPISLITTEKYYPETDIIMPSYDEVIIKETSLEQESTTELLLKSKNKKQKFVKLTEVKTIKL